MKRLFKREAVMQDLRCSILHNWNMRRHNGPGVTKADKQYFRDMAVAAVRKLRDLREVA